MPGVLCGSRKNVGYARRQHHRDDNDDDDGVVVVVVVAATWLLEARGLLGRFM